MTIRVPMYDGPHNTPCFLCHECLRGDRDSSQETLDDDAREIPADLQDKGQATPWREHASALVAWMTHALTLFPAPRPRPILTLQLTQDDYDTFCGTYPAAADFLEEASARGTAAVEQRLHAWGLRILHVSSIL